MPTWCQSLKKQSEKLLTTLALPYRLFVPSSE